MTYIVEAGDNIASIAKKFGISVVDLVKENNLENIYYLEPGLELIIPSVNNDTTNPYLEEYTVKQGDNLYQIGLLYGIDYNLIAQINGLETNEYIYSDQKILVPKKGIGIYITQDNDILSDVANKLNVPMEDIIKYNKNLYLLPEQLIVYRNDDNMNSFM